MTPSRRTRDSRSISPGTFAPAPGRSAKNFPGRGVRSSRQPVVYQILQMVGSLSAAVVPMGACNKQGRGLHPKFGLDDFENYHSVIASRIEHVPDAALNIRGSVHKNGGHRFSVGERLAVE